MDQAILVRSELIRSDLKLLGLVVEALSRAKIPVTLCDWSYVPEAAEWRLIIATPWYDSKGPHEAYSRVIKAFQEAGIYQEVPMLRIFVRSPEEPLVKALEREAKDRQEGTIHVAKYAGPDHKRYSMIFAPYAGRGGAVPARYFSKPEELDEFLDKRLHIGRSLIQDALVELKRTGRALIFHVELTVRKARKLGLA